MVPGVCKRGLVAAGGGLVRLPRQIPPRLAMEFAIVGDFVDSQRAYDMGLINRVVPQGTALRFRNLDVPIGYGYGIWHSITTCKLPCNKSTGIAYPVADGPVISHLSDPNDAQVRVRLRL